MKTVSTKKRLWRTFLVACSITAIFGSCQDEFNEILGICPEVESTNPTDEATGVPLNPLIAVTFNGDLNPATVTDGSFSLRVINTSGTIESSVSGSLSYDELNNTINFLPNAPLAPNTTYTGTVEPVVKDLTGNALQSPYVWTFTTGASPTVIATDPENLSTGILLDKTITAKFSEKMDPLTIRASSFTLKSGTTLIDGEVNYMDSVATFTPTIDLLPGTTYIGTISVEAANLDGIPLEDDFSWSFTTALIVAPTVLSTDPNTNETNVELSKTVNVTFSEEMSESTITGTNFTLQQGANTINGSVTYNGTTASFTPNSPLSPNLTYTGTITTGAQNLAGIALANDYVWTFQTLSQQSAYFVDLKSVGRFGIFAATGISNNAGLSEIRNLDVGITPGFRSSVTGFPPAILVNGAIHAADDINPPGVAAMLVQAKSDLTEAYLFAEGATSPAPATVEGDQGGKTLAPGIYKSNSTLLIQGGDLTLDAQGNQNAVWIFQIASGFTTVGGAGGNIILSGGAKAENIFWQVGSSATIGDNTQFYGNVLALTSITLNSNAKVVGRMLVINGAVVMTNTNIIEKP